MPIALLDNKQAELCFELALYGALCTTSHRCLEFVSWAAALRAKFEHVLQQATPEVEKEMRRRHLAIFEALRRFWRCP